MTAERRLRDLPKVSARKSRARTQPPTGLYNRRLFLQRAMQEHKLSLITGKPCTLFFVDITGLQQIKDRFGPDESRAVEKTVGAFLKSSFRAGDIAGRLADGEFAVLAAGCNNPERSQTRLVSQMNHYHELFPRPYPFSVRIHANPLS